MTATAGDASVPAGAEHPPEESFPTVPVRLTAFASIWRDVVCPRCGSMAAEGNAVVLCPHCGTPNHLDCWRDHGDACGACGAPADLREPANRASPGLALAPAPVAPPRVDLPYPAA